MTPDAAIPHARRTSQLLPSQWSQALSKSTGLDWQINKSIIPDPDIGIEFIKPQGRLRVFRALELSVWPRDLCLFL